jgi:ubiquinone/menaquinone biosynthesis C-methylase UbiE
MPNYSEEPQDRGAFTASFDRAYTRFARVYDAAIKLIPLWKGWLRPALRHLQGPRILEVSFGTGYLMTEYAGRFEVYGLDLNDAMILVARENLRRAGLAASLCRGTVEALPYRSDTFDSVLNTMAFSGYPDARKSLEELLRLLRAGGRLVLIDINYPADGNWFGTRLTELWKRGGDLIRDMGSLFRGCSVDYVDENIGGWGSVHLYVATRGLVAGGRGVSR